MDIHDWWNRTRGDNGSLKLSSRRLLTIVSLLPNDSAFKLEATEDWSLDTRLLSGVLNELRIMRSENAVFNGNDYREPNLVKSPSQVMAEQITTEHNTNVRTGIMAQLNRKT